ncbi:MAG: sulfite exporter TauE/SafE family protein [Deltaproteobacteria bacterium]|nr:sulfite exporter TauE/SafE family protein [Deltaproteobacteria bacterium]
MDHQVIALLTAMIFAAATLYSSVGHGGASGYLAAMAIFGLAPAIMRPTALLLNILVASLAAVKFYRAGCFSWGLFWPFAVSSIPMAFIGGTMTLPGVYYKPLVGLVLLFSAITLLLLQYSESTVSAKPLPVPIAVGTGAGIGLLAGLTGVGGGIFLSPLLFFTGWARPREIAGISATFILINSFSGILGHLSTVASMPPVAWIWGISAIVGGWIGSGIGSRRLNTLWFRRLLGLVLMIAGFKMIFA